MKIIVYSEDPNFKARELEMDENFVNDYPEIDTGLLHIDNAPKICYGYARFVIGGR